MRSTREYSKNPDRLREAISDADAILIGAGAGLSTAAGLTYSGERFEKHFSDFEAAFGIHDIYSGGFYPFPDEETYWGWWCRHIWYNRYAAETNDVYDNLFRLVKNENYFVLTTNVDHQFQNHGFDKERLFYTQGDYGLFQCSVPCHPKTYDNRDVIEAMVKNQQGLKIPTELIPRCPVCGAPMTVNLRSDATFVEDAGWHEACRRYEDFVEANQDRKILYLELGVGANTPGIIKYPFWQLTYRNPGAVYACLNRGEALCPREIEDQSILIDADIAQVLRELV